jgi:threonine dehydratase
VSLVTWADIHEAQARIAPFAHRTPVFTSSSIDRCCGASVFFKCENFQKTGSFKFRGACNAVASLNEEERSRGVLTHSSGNHAQALALAARMHGVRAFVVMPDNASVVKRRATEKYGATVIPCPPTQRGREQTARRVKDDTGAVFIDSHDDPLVIAGQGTAAAELIDEVGAVDAILAPVGGGGLLSGTLIATRQILPNAVVVGCEPSGADDAYRSLKRGERITDFVPDTIADGLLTPLGVNTFAILHKTVDDILLVTDEQTLEAMRFVWERMKIVIEPSSAIAVAPLLNRSIPTTGKRIGVILSGGNVDCPLCSNP